MTDPFGPLKSLRAGMELAAEALREWTIIVSPAHADRVKRWIEETGLTEQYHVSVDALCPDDRYYLIDRKALTLMPIQTSLT